MTRNITESFLGLSILDAPITRARVIDYVIERNLQKTSEWELITEDHPCFAPALEFRDQWGIRSEVWNNFSRLLQGWRQLPLILLHNPSNTHDMAFEEMIQGYTLNWISEQLATSHLSIPQVPILDVCSFFSDGDLQAMDETTRYEAVEASYDLTESILAILKPRVILSCQCATQGYSEAGQEVRRRASNLVARQLGSTIKDAVAKRASPIDIQGHRVWVVKGFHPSALRHRPDNEPDLLRLFEEIYEPYTRWKRPAVIETLEQTIIGIETLLSSLEICRSRLEDLCLRKKHVRTTTQLIAELEQSRKGFQSVVQCLKAS
ncbi:hypothetical protein CDEST_02020 [Colletotrichum destructivum]|uniref:Uncharacterized protein n=1 Tax=Colletotrichum destructivum TaxID=34406 RepID=A0AAX4I1P1_9PEZI|nr:hypothetical protein CDEST_02020 [Colletotrichum destructivum]